MSESSPTSRETPASSQRSAARIYFSSDARRQVSTLRSADKGELLVALDSLRAGWFVPRVIASGKSSTPLQVLQAGDLSVILRELSAEERETQGAGARRAYIVLAIVPGTRQLSEDRLTELLVELS